MKNFGLLFLLMSSVSVAAPYKIMVVADDESMERAQEFKNYLKGKPPFNRMNPQDLEIKIITMPKAEMNCGHTMPGAPRIITCDHAKLARMQAQEEASLALAFTSSGSGGAGGEIPVASKDYPLSTMLHEMLHAYGCDDEYEYSESEAEIYCQNPRARFNAAFFRDIPPYGDDAGARVLHGNDVPWMGRILPTTLIVQGSALGSAVVSAPPGQQAIGLFKGGSCEKKIPTWRPYNSSIMKEYLDDTIYPIYEDLIVKNIESKIGRRLALAPVNPPAIQPADQECPPALEGNLKDISDMMKKLAN